MRKYVKPALTAEEQVALLRQRGMVVADPTQAAFYLSQINFYRLSAYWLPFEESPDSHRFKPGTDFDEVFALYSFDRELRLLLLDAIERVEVAVRTRWTYAMAHLHDPHSYLDPGLSKSIKNWTQNLATLIAEVGRSEEVFIRHYKETYNHPELPPIWAVCEVMSLGLGPVLNFV